MKKDTLINLYWILDAVRKGSAPNVRHVGECFITIRDELLLPDTEDIVVQIRSVLEKSQATADVMSQALIDSSRRTPLPEQRLLDMMTTLTGTTPGEVSVAFARLVEAAHGVQS